MAAPQQTPLRPLTAAERRLLTQIARAPSERADRVARATALLAVADGASFAAAARAAGRRAGDAVAKLVARFDAEGLAALDARHGGGPPVRYGSAEAERILREARRPPDRAGTPGPRRGAPRPAGGWPPPDPRHGAGPPVRYGSAEAERILREARRPPDRATDGTATWSLTTLQRALRSAPDGLPTVSTFTILRVLHDAGLTWQRDRTWCQTGVVLRKRKAGVVEGIDPATGAKRG